MWYHVSEPNSYLAVTGAGIETVKVVKKCFIYPFQKVTKISITPFDFSMALQAMTSEKLQFSLPAVFTIGPADEQDALVKYAVLLTGDSDGQVQTHRGTVSTGRNHVQDIVKGIIEGETRSIVSNMTMEELFNNRRIFKSQVLECVQKELDQFGLRIYNANVKELQDLGESRYFESLSRKAHEGAQSQAQVDVAHARMVGRIGEAEKEGETKQKIAKINAHTAVLETERKVEKADADKILRTREIMISKELRLEQIAADRAAEQKDAQLQQGVEEQRAKMELEKSRATTVTQAKIARESAQQRADAEYYSTNKKAEAQRFVQEQEASAVYSRAAKDAEALFVKRVKEAEARERDADSSFYANSKSAEALFYSKSKETEALFYAKSKEAEASYNAQLKEAQGMQETAKAYGALSNVLGGPQGLMQYLMLQNNTYEKLAAQNAKAINGLQPKINVWNTGSNTDGVDATAPIRNLFQTLPPLFSTIQEQTGMAPPAWMAQMPGQQQQQHNGEMSADEKAVAKKRALMNGH